MKIASIILGILLIIGGISLMATPLVTFLETGYFIIILFFVSGIFGIVRGISEKRYGPDFFFSILSLILGIVGFVIPGAVIMSNFVILYLAAAWFIVRGVLSVAAAIGSKKLGAGTGAMAAGIILGILELILGVYSIVHPLVLAVALGLLIGVYFVEAGINMIVLGTLFPKKESND